uniref:Tyrosine-protein kinase transmembrane receptor Ror-like isoform X2 n=1 Tax=Crassostrea virginica TaxID=6565 RepID=A0A8B8DKH6_CRAVI|nr:tyrosine-protein kinase transmembrane receptor Ror-like isoform X2 [Crassostrea virginica]
MTTEKSLDYRPCNPDIGDECPFLGESMCFEGKCMCINTLVPTTPEGKCKGNYRKCDSKEDCYNHTSTSIPDTVECLDNEGRGFSTCYCVDHLKEADRDGVCDISPVTQSSPKVRYSGFIVFVDNNKNETSTPHNITQNIVLSAAETQTLLQIFIPVSFLITLLTILILVFARKSQMCHKKKKKKDVIIRNNEDIQLLDRMNFVNKNPTYFMTSQKKSDEKKVSIKEIPYERVKIIETVGEGAFGHVYKGLYYTPDCPDAKDVAIKILKEGVSNEVKEDFEREVEIMSNFNHDNILSLLGVITKDVGDSPYMIFEYMIHGDLAELLRRNDPVMRKSENDFKLQKNDLIDVALQIANGMKYLTSQHFVHRDLATRNCLVGDGLIVKISDFGMARDVYTHDYYKIGGSRMLPVRWMSPESVKYGCFTNESDIWAYGVVLWEIYSYGRQPYYGHSNEEVVRFLDEGILLQRPEECPYIVYHIMLSCWKTDPKERHSFFRIHKHLTDFSKEILKSSDCSINVTETQDVC